MKTRAIQRNVHISYRKANLVCSLIRNKPVNKAISILNFTNKKTSKFLTKLLLSAIANATNNHAMNVDKLYVYSAIANQGSSIKRTIPRARGSADLIKKRFSHLEIVLSDDLNDKKHVSSKKNNVIQHAKVLDESNDIKKGNDKENKNIAVKSSGKEAK